MADNKETPRGWQLLHSKLPPSAIKPLATSVYGVAGLSDVNEGYLIRRLFGSELAWDWRVMKQEYLGFEDRTSQQGKDYRVYMAAVHGELSIEGRIFHGSGASDNRKLDAAYKGANTVAFKNACKWAGLTAELFLDGRAIDVIYSERIRKDPDMTPASVEALVAQIEETYGDPVPKAQSEAPKAAPRSAEIGPINGSAEPASSEPDLSDLFALARTLTKPATNVQVKNEVATDGVENVRMRLIQAHQRDHGIACSHVVELAGLA